MARGRDVSVEAGSIGRRGWPRNIAPLAMLSFRDSEFHEEFVFAATQGVRYIRGRLDFTRVSFLTMPNFLGGRQLI